MKRFIFILIIVLSLFSINVYSAKVKYACYDKLAGIDYCVPFDSKQEASLLCCGTSECSNVDVYDKNKCGFGCCLPNCDEKITRNECKTTFIPTKTGLCLNDNGILPYCQKSCCCVDGGYEMTTKNLCKNSGGIIHEYLNQNECKTTCNQPCTNGCSNKKPLYCKDGKVFNDCTGGDGIVGNGNDCGCSSSQKCLPSGSCVPIKKVKTCKENGKLSCDGICIKSCKSCINKHIEKNGVCIKEEKSEFCPDGMYDDYCHSNLFIDLNQDGCQKENPCRINKKSINYTLYILTIVFLLILFVIWRNFKGPKSKIPEVSTTSGVNNGIGGKVSYNYDREFKNFKDRFQK